MAKKADSIVPPKADDETPATPPKGEATGASATPPPAPSIPPKKEEVPNYDFGKWDELLERVDQSFDGFSDRLSKLLEKNPQVSKDEIKLEFKTVLEEYLSKRPKNEPKAKGFLQDLNEMLGF